MPVIIAVSFQSIISILLILCLGFKWHVIILAIIMRWINVRTYGLNEFIDNIELMIEHDENDILTREWRRTGQPHEQ